MDAPRDHDPAPDGPAPDGNASAGDVSDDSDRPDVDLPPADELFARHLPDLTTYVRRRTDPLVASRESSRDLVQSVCREVIEHGDRFRHGSEEEFRRWLFRTAERKIIGRYRFHTAERRAVSREQSAGHLGVTAGVSASPSQAAMGREQLDRLELALASLSPDYREVIVLARMEQLGHREIARRMGRSEGAVRNLLYRGLVALAAALDEGPSAR